MKKAIEIAPWVWPLPLASCITLVAAATALTKICFGFQPSFFTNTNPWIANLPNAKIISVFAPAALSRATWDWTSDEVGS